MNQSSSSNTQKESDTLQESSSLTQSGLIDTSSLIGGIDLNFDKESLERQQERDTIQCFFQLSQPTNSTSIITQFMTQLRNFIFLLLHLMAQTVK